MPGPTISPPLNPDPAQHPRHLHQHAAQSHRASNAAAHSSAFNRPSFRQGIYIFCDEVYRELEHNPATRLPAGCDLYDRAVSLGSMSKTYGLPGLRLGWLASRDPEILKKCTDLKYYTTICSSAPSEFLTDLALRHREKIVDRNRGLVLRNLELLTKFLARRSDLFSWTPPNASPIGFVQFKPKKTSTNSANSWSKIRRPLTPRHRLRRTPPHPLRLRPSHHAPIPNPTR